MRKTSDVSMGQAGLTTPELLDKLEKFYGKQEPCWPVDPYEFIVWWHCGYPASDAACTKGWDKLNSEVGVEPHNLLEAAPRKLASALKPGGMVPELRALRLKQIAMRVKDEFGGDLRAALAGPLSEARKTLKKFPGIADPGADRILLFAGITPIAAVPSNCTQVLVRVLYGQERENYGANYREAQQAIAAEVPKTFDARTRAYLLLKHHGQEICKRAKPKCEECPVSANCAFFAGRPRRSSTGDRGTLRPP
jgi:endonuclease-3